MKAPIFILAGESSGDALAARLMSAIEKTYGKQSWVGVGGEKMQAQGLNGLADMNHLSVIGFSAVLTAYPKLSAFANDLVSLIVEQRPKLVITVDAKGFSIRLAARLKTRMAKQNWRVPIIHTVAPTVWAWGAWRRHKFARNFDGILCLFPNEPAFFDGLDVLASFISHPEAWTKTDRGKREALDASPNCRLCLLPGSRRSEVALLLPRMLAAVDILTNEGIDLSISLPTVASVAGQVKNLCTGRNIKIAIGRDAFITSIAKADAMVAASGTVTLQTALHAVPGIVCYATSPLSAFIGRRLVNMDNVVLPNALLGQEVYPFLFQEQATPQALAWRVKSILADGNIRMQTKAHATALTSLLRGAGQSFDDMVAKALKPWMSGLS